MTFKEVINQDKPVLIDFSASWCGPCKMLAPILVDVKKSVGNTAAIYNIDVDQNPKLSAQFQVRSVPTLILFKNGKQLWRKSGVLGAADLEKLLREHMN